MRGDFGTLDDAIADVVDLVVSEAASYPPLPIIVFGHSLGSMVAFLAAHKLETTPSLPSPSLVVLSGFAMDSVSPPFGVSSLIPLLRAVPSVIHKVTAVLSAVNPYGPACPLPAPNELTHDQERAEQSHQDPLMFHGWIMNRTALALMDGRARCRRLLSEWGSTFPFLLVHGGADELCPRTACDLLMAQSPQVDKKLAVFDGLRHEVLNERPRDREQVLRCIIEWIRQRLGGPLPARHSLRSKL
jgi:alpha-beta hydrolase superfamily lysophospholipase